MVVAPGATGVPLHVPQGATRGVQDLHTVCAGTVRGAEDQLLAVLGRNCEFEIGSLLHGSEIAAVRRENGILTNGFVLDPASGVAPLLEDDVIRGGERASTGHRPHQGGQVPFVDLAGNTTDLDNLAFQPAHDQLAHLFPLVAVDLAIAVHVEPGPRGMIVTDQLSHFPQFFVQPLTIDHGALRGVLFEGIDRLLQGQSPLSSAAANEKS